MNAFLSRLSILLRTRQGILFIGVGLFLVVLAGISSCKSKVRSSDRPAPRTLFSTPGSNQHISVVRRIEPVKATPLKTNSLSLTNKRSDFYSVHVDLSSDAEAPSLVDYAPMGRLVQCQLVNTIESIDIATPIIGLTVEDLWHDGKLIIEAGTEVHGKARVDPVRERLGSTGPWTFVFHHGEEIIVSGVALDREFDANGAGWSITDGSAGLRGEILKSDSLAEIKLFLATALSGMSGGLQQTRSSIFGFQAKNTLQNAGLSGASKVLDAYAQQVLEAIKRDGLYVRVPAGKQFYVYLTQTIDKSKARVGASLTAQNSQSEPRTNRTQASVSPEGAGRNNPRNPTSTASPVSNVHGP